MENVRTQTMCCLCRIPIVRILLAGVIVWFLIARRGERPDVDRPLPVLWREVPRLSLSDLSLPETLQKIQKASGVRIEIQGDVADIHVKPTGELAGRLD